MVLAFRRHARPPPDDGFHALRPGIDDDRPARKTCRSYATSHIDIADVSTGQRKMEAAQFLRAPIGTVPYRIHTVLTDNAVQFTNHKQDAWASHHLSAQAAHVTPEAGIAESRGG